MAMTPVKETVWWNTPGGRVTEFRDQAEATCSLMLYNADGSVTFAWDDHGSAASESAEPGSVLVTAINWDWQFPSDRKQPVAVQVGDVWLADRASSVVLDAVGHGNAVAFTTDKPVDELLKPADHITVRTTNAEMSIPLKRDKVGVLLSRARMCRDAIGK
jgi:hypothetical protein